MFICDKCGQATNSVTSMPEGEGGALVRICSVCYDKRPVELTCDACGEKIVGTEGDRPHPNALLWKHSMAHTELQQTCPRRGEIGNAASAMFPGPDAWSNGKCTYCGSASPAKFFEAIERGAEIEPTDKNYKVYISGIPAGDGGKFYFQHLSIEQRKAFVEMLNGKKIRIGYPGHFYVLPFFCERKPPTEPKP